MYFRRPEMVAITGKSRFTPKSPNADTPETTAAPPKTIQIVQEPVGG
jgi:hypothetical protein